ncbi:MAG TPA: hypothetical protein PLF13_03160 [candidate division Zixibacteria bacterium]|nr:hypothetical protein [candidate division Zixibacteria bacterium]
MIYCSYCSEPINGKPINQGGEYFCSLECAHRALGIDTDEPDAYYDENELEGLWEEEDDA